MVNINTEFEQMSDLDIAIIGMSGRFPGANNVHTFWQNLQNKIESISFLSNQDLVGLNLDRSILESSQYVKAAPVLEDIESFDASFFGFSPKEAEFMDPQNRLFMECAWEAFEEAGYDPETHEGLIGVYGGISTNTYFLNNIYKNIDLIDISNTYAIDKDFLATGISYKLNLKGPSLSVQTYCSTSLVAVHLACKSLLDEECDMALAGGVAIQVPHKSGYLYREDGISSPDGHCRAFDAKAQGTVFGSGLGIVLLKRLKDAISDRDCIHAVIKGSAINNDGSLKVSYAAPSVDGQAEVIVEALANAGIDAEDISYIEAHGTGTAAGDPVEIAALTKAFQTFTKKNSFCPIGSVKTNIGHLDAAAGIASLIKTVLALKHQKIPPSLHFETPNPQIDFANSPFYVNTKLTEWETNSIPRRAGVSSLGFGGTNAHVILEEAPEVQYFEESRPWQLLLLSAKTISALETATANLAAYLKQNLEVNLADIAYTLQVGRRAFNYRRMLVCQSSKNGLNVLEKRDQKRIFTVYQEHREQPVVFMFSGQGVQYVNMARQLYEVEPIFKQQVDACAQILHPQLKLDIRQILFPQEGQIETASQHLQRTEITQPALFVIEYALAQLWQEWGVCPEAMIGHSIGEYVAATIAGVFSLEDALIVVATRAKLMQQLPPGNMLAIPLPEEQVQSWLEQLDQKGISCQLAAINGPCACVVSGPQEAISSLQEQLSAQGIKCRLLQTSHAFHSEMMEPIVAPFVEALKQVKLNPPRLRFISNMTGDWITAEQAISPNYWGQHLRQTVRFSTGILRLLEECTGVFLEVGPGRTLSTLTTQHLQPQAKQQALSSLHHAKEPQSDVRFLLQTLGRLWLAGVDISWPGFYAHEQRHRLPLPTYPFERQRYWIDPPKSIEGDRSVSVSLAKNSDISNWFYVPTWKQSVSPIPIQLAASTSPKSFTLVFVDDRGLGARLIERLQAQNQRVITVKVGPEFAQLSEGQYTLNPGRSDDYDTLLQDLLAQQQFPEQIIHMWNVTALSESGLGVKAAKKAQEIGFYSLLSLAKVLSKQNLSEELTLTVVSNGLQLVTGEEPLSPEKATLLGPVKVISQEYQTISCRSIDVVLSSAGSWQQEKLIDHLLAELRRPISGQLIAYRGHNRWVQTFESVRLDESVEETPRLREEGVYLITGGLGGLGLVLAKYLAEEVQAKLVLTGRSVFPVREEWDSWIATHEETNSVSQKIGKVRNLEALGAEVLVLSADVGDSAQMREAMKLTQQQFGQLHGVIHAAGIVEGNSFSTIAQLNKIECEQQFQSKVYGLLVLEEVLQGQALDFCVLMSSLSSVLGGLGYVAYGAANLFMDAFTAQQNKANPVPWFSLNWDTWQVEEERKRVEFNQTGLTKFIVTPEEGVDAFQRILSRGEFYHQIVVSTGDLQLRLKKWTSPRSLRDKAIDSRASLYQRPDLQSAYLAPRNEIEQKLADIWQEMLGIKQVGIHDNFFELGGDSLVMMQLISQVRKAFHVELSMDSLFSKGTVAEIAQYIEKILYTVQQLQAPIGLDLEETIEVEL
ncbi:MAG: SDR family NAD(P)-dependent oxidoreductase [Leptolyngbya sp. SIO1E4]|nr:SDR family NAD(P)-dependent oxidoreductase [Leptolyngbya sp. SIO1E4]